MKISLEFEISDEFLRSILETAAYRSIEYWADFKSYDPEHILAVIQELEADEDDGMHKRHHLSKTVLFDGLLRSLDPKFQLAPHIRKYIYDAVRENDPGNIDSGAADVIIQAAIFKEVKYG